jgi:folylpolyglutamate synthase/dihydropteroate synthase
VQVERLRQADGSAGPWLLLDGAHTPAAASGLATTLRAVFPDAPLAVVVAMAADKDAAGVMAALRTARPEVMVFTSTAIAGSSARCEPHPHKESKTSSVRCDLAKLTAWLTRRVSIRALEQRCTFCRRPFLQSFAMRKMEGQVFIRLGSRAV